MVSAASHSRGVLERERSRWRAPALLMFGLGVVLALVLALPGETIATRGLEDLFSILDGAHRIAWGQVPNRDFHSALGPLVYYLPALGLGLSGSYGAALPIGMGLLLVVVAAIAAHVLSSRLHLALALPFAAFLFLVLAVPMHLGEGVTALSFLFFHNRIGWVCLALLLVMYVEPKEAVGRGVALDIACATILVLVMVYTRATYGMVGGAFLLLMLITGRWRWAGGALLATLLVAGGIELVWHGSASYASDVLMALQTGGWWRGTQGSIIDLLLGNFADYLLFGLLVALLFWRRFNWRDLLFFLFCAVAGYWLINQNEQRWGILTLHAGAAVAAEYLLRNMAARAGRPAGAVVNPPGVTLYFAALLLPTIVHCSIALLLHAGTALVNGGQALAIPRLEGVRLANLWTNGDFNGSTWYLGTITDGLAALENLPEPPQTVQVLNTPNPFSLALNLPPPAGDKLDLRWNATLNETFHPAPEDLFADAAVVMERTSAGGSGPVGQLYLPYVTESYSQVAQTPNWRLFRRDPADTGMPAAAAAPAPLAP
ncbi:hypothetical protein [Devosia sp. 1566]|uniref:hypothetical protein n=1 Tax=Devosia sp. 1566 TaxID=2499144 RepID=UPI000FDABAC4|nr:hypothetical protein [Devosia sp. 1566]